jgi:hypothetical protein
MRLTKKLEPPYEKVYGKDYVYTSNTRLTPSFASVEQKLGQLEDVEEELGIDLITLFKALKQGGVYVKEGNKVDWCLMMKGFEITGDGNEISLWSQVKLEPKDYGKTWSLTKEELL